MSNKSKSKKKRHKAMDGMGWESRPIEKPLGREFDMHIELVPGIKLDDPRTLEEAKILFLKGSAYNERPKDRPNCPNCIKKLSPAGGTLDGNEMFWACWDCGYRHDIPSNCL